MKSDILNEEIRRIIDSVIIDKTKLRNNTILVMGGTGFIGSILVMALLLMSRKYNLNLTVICMVRSTDKSRSVFSDFLDSSKIKIRVVDLISDKFEIEEFIDFIIHTAAITDSREIVKIPIKTIDVAIVGIKNTRFSS